MKRREKTLNFFLQDESMYAGMVCASVADE